MCHLLEAQDGLLIPYRTAATRWQADREYLDNIRKHSGAFTEPDFESVDEDGVHSSVERVKSHEQMKILYVHVLTSSLEYADNK